VRHVASAFLLLVAAACGASKDGFGGDPRDAALPADAAFAVADAPLAVADAAPPPPDAGPPDAPPPDANPQCIATSAETLVACGAAMQAGGPTTLILSGAITCSGADACNVHLDGVAGPLTIRGAAGSVLRRVDHHENPLFDVAGGSVSFRDLTVDENQDAACTAGACGPTLLARDAASVTLDTVTIVHAKGDAVRIEDASLVTVRKLRLALGAGAGLVVDGVTTALDVDLTYITGNLGRGLVLSDAHGTAAAPLRLRRLFLAGNGGGQLLFSAIDFLRVEDSVIRDGAGGLELGPEVKDLLVTRSDLHGHTGLGVYPGSSTSGIDRVFLVDNKLYANSGGDVGSFVVGTLTDSNSCHTADCRAVKRGAAYALPGQATWATNDFGNPRVEVNGSLKSQSPSGTMAVASGSIVLVCDNFTEFDRVLVP